MFKTKVLNKHLALALTSGLLLMANAVNAEPYIIGSITPADNDGILKGNNVVVTQNTNEKKYFSLRALIQLETDRALLL